MAQLVRAQDAAGKINGILLDLGVSSPQLDQPERGFSFDKNGPLDMRMNPTQGLSAAQWLATVPVAELRDVIARFGEERFAPAVARAIVRAREKVSLTSTKQLADLVKSAIPARAQGRKHPATRTFQAIRIYLNRELDILDGVMTEAVTLLAPGGRLAVITFHSLEDRIVKRCFRQLSTPPPVPRGMPSLPEEVTPPARLIGKPIRPSDAELDRNPRSRSATLRVLEKCP